MITNLNDNVDRQFLSDLVHRYGATEEIKIFYHPVTKKHLGVARVVFLEVSEASACIAGLHMRPVMGKQLSISLDPFGKLLLREGLTCFMWRI